MTTTHITGALVVIVAAAGVAVGALALDAGGSPAPASNSTATTVQAANPSPVGSTGSGDGYCSDAASGATQSGSDAADGNAGGAAAGNATATLQISGFQFSSVSVAPGGQVTVQNQDSATHTVTSSDGAFDTGDIAGGATATFTAPSTPGTYQFHCDIHPDMTGTLTVG
jgi:plastocyanin